MSFKIRDEDFVLSVCIIPPNAGHLVGVEISAGGDGDGGGGRDASLPSSMASQRATPLSTQSRNLKPVYC